MAYKSDEELVKTYGKSEHGNYYVVGSIGTPHPYTIGAKHVAHAADRHGGQLNTHAIESGEKIGITCRYSGCKLSYAEHKQGLLVRCTRELADANGEAVAELREYLMKCKPMCEADGYEGFAFIRG